MNKKVVTIFVVCVLLIVAPFIIARNGAFEGSDDQAEELITSMNGDYEPWFESIWEPPSGEVESFLFSFQAAVGAGFIGFYIGKKKYDKGNKSLRKNQ